MPMDNTALLNYFLQDDIYLLKEDRALFAGPSKPGPAIETKKPRFNYLGSNKSKFLILVNYAGDEHMDAAHLTALESTLGRKGLLVDDVAILNIAAHTVYNSADILAFFEPLKILILGKDAVLSGLPVSAFNVIETKAGYTQLHTYSFIEMVTNQYLKRPFWEQIKNF